MINGSMGDSFISSHEQLRTEYGDLAAAVETRAEADEASITAAFAEAASAQRRSLYTTLGVLIVMLLGLVLLSNLIARSIEGIISTIADAAARIAKGDIEQEIDYVSADEIGRLADSFRDLVAYIGDVSAAADRLARGDLSGEIVRRSDKDVLSANVRRAHDTLRALIDSSTSLITAARSG